MDQTPASPPPPPPPPGPQPHYQAHHQAPAHHHHPPPGQVVQVMQRPSGFGRTFGAMITSFTALGAVFLLGIGVGLVVLVAVGAWAGSSMGDFVLRNTYRSGGTNEVVVLPIHGVIDARQSQFVRVCVDDILERRATVRAVVLRVNSPGGGVTASDEIWHELGRLKTAGLPLIASYGSVAASGGYYVSCDSDFIMAQETSMTGSIGVIAQIMTFGGLMDKMGVEPVTLVAHGSPQKSIANDTFREWTEKDREQVLGMLDSAYDTFHARVKQGRGNVITDPAVLSEIANGSVFTARDALANGLIDGIGYLDDAIAQAEKAASLPPGGASVMMLGQRPTLFGSVPFLESAPPQWRGPLDGEQIRSLVNDLGSVRLMYLTHQR